MICSKTSTFFFSCCLKQSIEGAIWSSHGSRSQYTIPLTIKPWSANSLLVLGFFSLILLLDLSVRVGWEQAEITQQVEEGPFHLQACTFSAHVWHLRAVAPIFPLWRSFEKDGWQLVNGEVFGHDLRNICNLLLWAFWPDEIISEPYLNVQAISKWRFWKLKQCHDFNVEIWFKSRRFWELKRCFNVKIILSASQPDFNPKSTWFQLTLPNGSWAIWVCHLSWAGQN